MQEQFISEYGFENDTDQEPSFSQNQLEDKNREFEIALAQLPNTMSQILIDIRNLPIKARRLKRIKKVNPEDLASHNWRVNYYAGSFNVDQNLLPDNRTIIDDGNPYFNHGVELKYEYQFPSNFYLTAALNYDVKYNLFEAEVQRDTIVPSSKGEQLIITNIYANGGIDNLSGIPEVSASLQRSVRKLNTIKSLNIALGAGYSVRVKRVRGYLEAQLMRSIYTDRSGLAILNKERKISNISGLEDLFSTQPQYNYQLGAGIDFPIYSNISLGGGIQYRRGLTNLIPGERGSVFNTSYSGVVGIKLVLK